jgi:hydrophobic/amphiphilic exporter-1 (mainly G- bacteria), HAE1 family
VISAFFIERPIFANVIAIITILLGAVCLYNRFLAKVREMGQRTLQAA